jgi:FlaA1/EpsC-like NDP-sugar epimerase
MTEPAELWKRLIRLLGYSAPWRPVAALVADAAIVAWCWHAAYLFRMGWERWQPARPPYDDYVLAAVLASELLVLWALGLYRMPWRFFGFTELSRLCAVFLGVGAVLATAVMGMGLDAVARSVLILHPLFCILALSVMRMAIRLLWEESQRRVTSHPELRKAVVLVDSTSADVFQALKPMKASPGWALLGVFTPHAATGGEVAGLRVLGDLAAVADHKQVAKAGYAIVIRDGSHNVSTLTELAYRTGKVVVILGSEERALNGDQAAKHSSNPDSGVGLML